ncbi:Molecular chaperone, HSP90 [Desulfitobacterium hafniense]|uniref:Molecular chaperone, HSP90 n=1 Tax=Desulfitobacterium hafniense TaxID=49338 RepID=A0A098AUE5_DESHA|nr:ATP-binding protein [Desulfitobacterium hafniense]CDW99969.1 Molecular chaperone, HSP90 [Desulfitobacterium hafniense]
MTKTIKETKAYSLLFNRKSLFLEKVNKIYDYAVNFLPKINRVFANYTGHDILHSLNVADYMYDICDYPDQLSDLELVVIIYTALLHDIGMVVSEQEIENIKNEQGNITDRKYSLVLQKYKDEAVALQECIRPIHGMRSLKHILEMDNECFILPGYTNISFQDDVAKICAAHNENFEWITSNLSLDQVKGNWTLNFQYIALLLRIADYLDIDEERAPLYLYQYLSPKDYGDLEWKQHFVIENKEKIAVDPKTGRKHVEFYGESSNPSIHRKLLKYFDSINDELKKAINYSETFRDKKYLLTISTMVHNKIRPKGFNFSDFKLSLDYKAVTSLLMGENIYGDKKYGLRELIQNSIDACMVMQEEVNGKDEFKYNPYQPFINVILDQDRKQVIVFDNGRGMSVDILKKYFLNVGVSYYVSDDYLFKGNKYMPIGNYGIGFLACFMLSDKVNVITKYYGESQANKIEFEKSSEYICLTYEDVPRSQGTEIILDYDQFLSVFGNSQTNVETFIKRNFIDCQIPIRLISSKDGKTNSKILELQQLDSLHPESIRLDKYFDGIQVALKFNYKGITYLKNFSDIYANESFIFQEDSNEIVSEQDLSSPVLLKRYITDGVIKFLSLPIIASSEEDAFAKAYDVLEDFEAALEKINYENANIITIDTSLYNDSELIDSSYDRIVGDFTLSDFRGQAGHSRNAPTYTFLEEKKVIHGSGDKILPYEADIGFQGRYSFEYTDYLYIKNVLISNARIKIPFLVEGIELKGLVVNVTNKKIIPNVSRNNISEQQGKSLSYAIGKALHMWIYENGSFDAEEKSLLKAFIITCYPEDNSLLKK